MTDEVNQTWMGHPLTCENMTRGSCIEDAGRTVDSPYGATGYCWPCRIRVGLPIAQRAVPALSVLDVAGKVAILTFPDDDLPADLTPMIESLAGDMRAAGAVSVIVLASGVTLTALSDEELASAGLERIPHE
jgi:hypothetical protein